MLTTQALYLRLEPLQSILLWLFWRWGWEGVSQTVCHGWPPTVILLISMARITRSAPGQTRFLALYDPEQSEAS
jgi:hypothetical protein